MNAINGFPLDPTRAHLPADLERNHIRVKAGFLSHRDGLLLVAELLKDVLDSLAPCCNWCEVHPVTYPELGLCTSCAAALRDEAEEMRAA